MESKKVTSKKARTTKDKSSPLAEITSSSTQTTAPRSAKTSPKNADSSDTASAKRHRQVTKAAETTTSRRTGVSGATATPAVREKAMAATAAQQASHFSAPVAVLDDGGVVAVTAGDNGNGVSQEEIARLAYSFWEQRGYGHGNSYEDWHRAEQALNARN